MTKWNSWRAPALACCLLMNANAYAHTVAIAPTPTQLQHLRSQPTPSASRAAELPVTGDYIDARPLGTPPPAKQSMPSESVPQGSTPAPSISAITPLCPTLSINALYTLSGTTTGGSYCYHFQITQRSKTQVLLVGQNANTNFALTLVRHEENDTLTVLGTSDNPANADESLLAFTAPGHYYWLMDANASDGTPFQFGAAVNTAIDASEPNDSPAQATAISLSLNPIVGNMDGVLDVDYFQFNAQYGQELYLQFEDAYGVNEWIVEYYTGSFWSPLSVNTQYSIPQQTAAHLFYVRIRPNPNVAINTAHNYRLILGSWVRTTDQVSVGSTENLARVPLGATNPSLVTQAHNQLNWTIRLLDSTGHPVPGAQAQFLFLTDSLAPQTRTAISNSAGVVSNTITLPDCSGNRSVVHPANGFTWLTEYDLGLWSIAIPYAVYGEVGVGGPNVPGVNLGHICRQTLQ